MKINFFKTKRSRAYLFFYKIMQFVVNIIFKPLFRIEIINREKSFYDGKLILCCNHFSAFDPVLMGEYFPRPVYFMAKRELFQKFLFRILIEFFNAFPVNRSGVDRKALAKAVEIINAGNMLGIFPEGTRSAGEEVGSGRKGVALIAYLTGAPILPMAICNLKKVSRDRKRYLWPKIKIIFGDLINTKEIFKKYSKKEGIDLLADLALNELKKLFSVIKK